MPGALPRPVSALRRPLACQMVAPTHGRWLGGGMPAGDIRGEAASPGRLRRAAAGVVERIRKKCFPEPMGAKMPVTPRS